MGLSVYYGLLMKHANTPLSLLQASRFLAAKDMSGAIAVLKGFEKKETAVRYVGGYIPIAQVLLG